DRLFAPGRLLAGRAGGRDQAGVERGPGLVQLAVQLAFELQVAGPGAVVMADQVGQVRGQDPAEPPPQLRLGPAPEPGEAAVGFKERLLDDAGGAALPGQSAADRTRAVRAR